MQFSPTGSPLRISATRPPEIRPQTAKPAAQPPTSRIAVTVRSAVAGTNPLARPTRGPMSKGGAFQNQAPRTRKATSTTSGRGGS